MKAKKFLVTGAGGFLGGAVAEYLHNEGHNVTGLYRNHKPEGIYNAIKADLSEPLNDINENFDVIVHAAGEKPVRKTEIAEYKQQDFVSFKKNNIDSIHNLINFARTHDVKKLIYLSTIGVHGDIRNSVLTEDSDIINPDAYGMTKYAAELLLKSCKDIQSISLRLPGVIGKGANNIWFTNVVNKMMNNEKITIYTPDFVTKNFVWIYDLCKFIQVLADMKEFQYDTLLLGCSEGIAVKNLIAAMLKATGSKSEIFIDNSVRLPFCIDSSKAVEMGYVSISPEDIVKEYLKIVQ